MAACVTGSVRLAMTLLLVFAVLILYAYDDLALHIEQASHNLESSLNRLRIATLQYKSGLRFMFSAWKVP
jgi:hypothetical protein